MTQRLTPEQEKHARWLAEIAVEGSVTGEIATQLLQEIDALRAERDQFERTALALANALDDARAELAGAEERGRQKERLDIVTWLKNTTTGTRACRDWVAYDVAAGMHRGTGTTPPDAGESGP